MKKTFGLRLLFLALNTNAQTIYVSGNFKGHPTQIQYFTE